MVGVGVVVVVVVCIGVGVVVFVIVVVFAVVVVLIEVVKAGVGAMYRLRWVKIGPDTVLLESPLLLLLLLLLLNGVLYGKVKASTSPLQACRHAYLLAQKISTC